MVSLTNLLIKLYSVKVRQCPHLRFLSPTLGYVSVSNTLYRSSNNLHSHTHTHSYILHIRSLIFHFINCREGPELSIGLNWGLSGKGVIVKEKVFQNLTALELRKKGATIIGRHLLWHYNFFKKILCSYTKFSTFLDCRAFCKCSISC